MSLGARATKGGAKGKDRHAQDKGKSDKPQPKEKVKPQATTEQLRMANMIDRKTEDTADVRKMVQDLMEMTCRTEEEVCSALHDADNDVVAACNLLLEAEHTGEWQTSEKKKKKPPAPTNNGEVDPPREPRSRSGPRPRRGEGERGERGDGATRGRGSGRGGRGAGRGGRGGARGGRGAPRPRPDRSHDWPHHPHSSDVNPMGDTFPATEDWDNEEWSGSLADTKVFTPSAAAQLPPEPEPAANQIEDWDAPEPPVVAEGHIPTYTYHNPAAHHVNLEQQLNSVAPSPSPHLAEPTMPQHQHQPHQPMGMSGSLTAAQSQYLSQLTQQSQRHDNSVYTTNYGVYGSTDMTTQRKPQRARVPPPSKIPMSAVEMPGGMDSSSTMFLDVQFGALEPELPEPSHKPPQPVTMPVSSTPAPVSESQAPAASASVTNSHSAHNNAHNAHSAHSAHNAHSAHSAHSAHNAHEPPVEQPVSTPYSTTNSSMLNESLSSAPEAAAPTAPPAAAVPEPVVSNSTTSLEKLSASMKQLATADAPAHHNHLAAAQHRHKPQQVIPQQQQVQQQTQQQQQQAQQNMYTHHPVSHHPPAVYSANVYAPQVNASSNASLTAAAAAAAGMTTGYPSSVTLTQYQPMMNSYQTSSTAAAYNSNALYTAAPYAAYQPPAQAKPPKEQVPQYDTSAVASSNSLTTASTTQPAAAKATTASGHIPSTAGSTGSTASASQYAAGALYGASQGYAAYDEQILRSTMPHHMSGYYEVGYGVGVGGAARDAGFSLGAGERFGRTDAASPQQVTAAALPPGYAYYYQAPPPTTYQYGVYPFGAGSNVGGVGGVGGVSGAGKVGSYAQQQPQYDGQDSYKPGGGYTGNANKAGAAAAADLSNAMYPKAHVSLNKVNSYEKAAFHSGTPPPFGAASHLYIAAPPHHHHHAPQHQMDVRMNSSQNRRQEAGSAGARAGAGKPQHSKPAYSHSYWPPN